MKKYYSNYYLSWDWTKPIIDKFLNSFSKFDANFINFREQIYIGVYGPTQVGKTTFILNLIGVREDKLEMLSEALRGGQPKGKSATVTATLYQQNIENVFEIIFPNKIKKICKDCNELEKLLKGFREEITLQNYKLLDEMTIKIPNNFFKKNSVDEEELIIVDLPGNDTKDESEEKHVVRILEKYLILCKTVLIMELSYKINNLFQLSLDSIKDWMNDSVRFFVVLTRAISNHSIQNKVLNGQINNFDEIKSIYLNDLTRAAEDNKNIKDLKVNFFCFELGSSLNSMKKRNENLYKKIKKWNENNFELLIHQLHKNNLPEFRIKSLKSITTTIEKLKKENLDYLEHQKSKEQNLNEKLRNRIDQMNVLINEHKNNYNMEFKFWKKLQQKTHLEKTLNVIKEYKNISFSRNKKKYSELNVLYQRLILKITPELNQVEQIIKSNKQMFSEKMAKDIISKISNLTTSGPLSAEIKLFKKSDINDYYLEVDKLYDNVKILNIEYRNFIEKSYNSRKESYKQKLTLLSSKNEKDLLSRSEKRIKQIDNEIKVADKEWMEEYEKVNLLEDIFLNEYIRHMKLLEKRLNSDEFIDKYKPSVLLEMNIITEQTKRVLKIYD